MQGHGDTTASHPRTEPLPYPSQFPEGAQQPCLVPVKNTGPDGADVSTGADTQQNHGQEALEVEQSRHSETYTRQEL